MRKTQTIKIDETEITLKEIRVRDVYELMSAGKELNVLALNDLVGRCSDLPREKLLDMAPSELKILWEAFKEVNSDFFSAARALGVEAMVLEILGKIAENLRKTLLEELVSSLAQVGTAQGSGITGGASS